LTAGLTDVVARLTHQVEGAAAAPVVSSVRVAAERPLLPVRS
jgi:hypothetical protein